MVEGKEGCRERGREGREAGREGGTMDDRWEGRWVGGERKSGWNERSEGIFIYFFLQFVSRLFYWTQLDYRWLYNVYLVSMKHIFMGKL